MLSNRNQRHHLPLVIALALAAGLTLTACGGLRQSEVDALREQVEIMEVRLDAVVDMVETAREDADGEVGTSLEEVQAELQSMRVLLEDVIAELAPPPPPEPVEPAAPGPPGAAPATPGF